MGYNGDDVVDLLRQLVRLLSMNADKVSMMFDDAGSGLISRDVVDSKLM